MLLEYAGDREFTQEVLGVIHRTHNPGFIMITWVGASDMEPESGYRLKISKGSHTILIIFFSAAVKMLLPVTLIRNIVILRQELDDFIVCFDIYDYFT